MEQKKKFVVGVIGTQNTGKSTFIRDLIESTRGTENQFNVVGCDYRKKIEEAGLQINRNGNLECQKIICDTLIEQIDIINTKENGNWITDRSPIDAYAYSVYLMRHNPDAGVTQSALDEMLEKVKDAVKAYDAIVYIDLNKCGNVVVVDDKFRDTNIEYRIEIDEIFKDTLQKLETTIPNKVVSDIFGDRKERVDKFKEKFYIN